MARILNELLQVTFDPRASQSDDAGSLLTADVSVTCDVVVDGEAVRSTPVEWLRLEVELLSEEGIRQFLLSSLAWVEIGRSGPSIRNCEYFPARVTGTFGFTRHCRLQIGPLTGRQELAGCYVARFTLSECQPNEQTGSVVEVALATSTR